MPWACYHHLQMEPYVHLKEYPYECGGNFKKNLRKKLTKIETLLSLGNNLASVLNLTLMNAAYPDPYKVDQPDLSKCVFLYTLNVYLFNVLPFFECPTLGILGLESNPPFTMETYIQIRLKNYIRYTKTPQLQLQNIHISIWAHRKDEYL